MLRADTTSVRQMFPSHRPATGHDRAARNRGRDFLFAPSPPNLRLMSEGEKDGYR